MTVGYLDPADNAIKQIKTADDVYNVLNDVIKPLLEGLTSTATAAPVYAIGRKYKVCAAGVTTNIFDTTGAVGDALDHIEFFFADTSPAGAITLKDGTTTLFAWTPGTLATNQFQQLILNIAAKGAGFNITLPSDVVALAVGNWA
jgi:hypothetical protein